MHPDCLKTVWTSRFFKTDAGCALFHYGLACDRTPNGGKYHYLKVHQEVWQDHSLLLEDYQVAGGFGAGSRQAMLLYRKICQSPDPVSPLHLNDIVRDALLESNVALKTTAGFL